MKINQQRLKGKHFLLIIPVLAFVCIAAALVPNSYAAIPAASNDVPVGNLSGWKQIYSEDFLTSASSSSFQCAQYGCSLYGGKMSAYPNGWLDTSKKGTYYPEKTLSVHDGLLDIHMFNEGTTFYSSAPTLQLPPTYDNKSAKIDVRFKSDGPVPGYKTAWLLWPKSEVWPGDGEIDFPEGDISGNMGGFMHRQNGVNGGDQDAYPNVAFSGNRQYTQWHTVTLEWDAGSYLKTYIDGVLFGTSTSRVPSTAMRYVLQTETCGSTCPVAGVDGHIYIDWIAYYEKAAVVVVVGDLNSDSRVNISDLSILISKWGTNSKPADINNDGIVNINDLSILLSHWTG